MIVKTVAQASDGNIRRNCQLERQLPNCHLPVVEQPENKRSRQFEPVSCRSTKCSRKQGRRNVMTTQNSLDGQTRFVTFKLGENIQNDNLFAKRLMISESVETAPKTLESRDRCRQGSRDNFIAERVNGRRACTRGPLDQFGVTQFAGTFGRRQRLYLPLRDIAGRMTLVEQVHLSSRFDLFRWSWVNHLPHLSGQPVQSSLRGMTPAGVAYREQQ